MAITNRILTDDTLVNLLHEMAFKWADGCPKIYEHLLHDLFASNGISPVTIPDSLTELRPLPSAAQRARDITAPKDYQPGPSSPCAGDVPHVDLSPPSSPEMDYSDLSVPLPLSPLTSPFKTKSKRRVSSGNSPYYSKAARSISAGNTPIKDTGFRLRKSSSAVECSISYTAPTTYSLSSVEEGPASSRSIARSTTMPNLTSNISKFFPIEILQSSPAKDSSKVKRSPKLAKSIKSAHSPINRQLTLLTSRLAALEGYVRRQLGTNILDEDSDEDEQWKQEEEEYDLRFALRDRSNIDI